MKNVPGMKSLRSLAALALAMGCGWGPSAFALAADAGMEFFEQKVRPLLADHCLGCHGGGTGEPKGGLRLDSKAGWEKGGANGPVLRAGRALESPLIKAVRRQPGVEAMPPDGEGRRALTQQEAGVLARWIAMGAPDPRDGKPMAAKSDGRAHWAFQPVVAPARPAVRDAAWPRADLDCHVLAGLERKDLQPSPRRTVAHGCGG